MATRKNDSNNRQDIPIASAYPDYGAAEQVHIDEPNAEVAPLVLIEKANTDPVCQDVWFAILFYLHLAVMIWLGIWVAPKGYATIHIDMDQIEDEMRKGDDVTEEEIQQFETFVASAMAYMGVYPQRIFLFLVIPCLILGFFFAFAATAFCIRPCPKVMVQMCLIGSFAWTALIMLSAAIGSGNIGVFLLTGVSFVAVGYYIRIAWRMIPFAAVNLKVALEGISRNCGTYILAFIFAELGFLWVVYWFYVLIGTFAYKYDECKKMHPDVNFEDEETDVCDPSLAVVLGFLLSFYWTSTVIMNTVQVTVAGVMATWCFAKDEANHCCSPAVFGSLYRSMTYSFGSICLGSLLQALISLLRFIVENARNQRDREDECGGCGALLLCILECLARLLEDIIEYFNQWAYCFVGIYGYSYLESGKRVIELFRARGWTSIITNNLVGYVLNFAAFNAAVVTGLVGLLVVQIVSSSLNDVETNSYVFGPLPGWGYWAFGIGFLVGLWVSSVMMNVVKGAVNTLIVCWADSPAVMEMNHPKLTKEMAESWTTVFPEASVVVRPTYNAVVV